MSLKYSLKYRIYGSTDKFSKTNKLTLKKFLLLCDSVFLRCLAFYLTS